MIRKEIFKVAAAAIFFIIFAYFFKSAEIISAQKTRDSNTAQNKTPILFDSYTDLDERLGEKIQLNELEATPKIAEAMKAQFTKARTDGSADEKSNTVFMRAAHSKAHCWITAQFKIMKDIPSDLQVGFALVDHKPLGGVNRVRFTTYKVISETRRTSNKVTSKELRGPTGREKF